MLCIGTGHCSLYLFMVQNSKKVRNFDQSYSIFLKLAIWSSEFWPDLNQNVQCFRAKQKIYDRNAKVQV